MLYIGGIPPSLTTHDMAQALTTSGLAAIVI